MENNQDFNISQIKNQQKFKPKKKFRLEKKYLWIGLAVLVFVLIIIIVIFFLRGWSFSKSNIELEIKGPSEIASGAETELIINCQNKNRIALNNVELIIDYPLGVYSETGEEISQQVIEIGKILSKEKVKKEVKIRIIGEKGTTKNIQFKLNYQPENTSSFYQNTLTFKTSITSVLIGLYLTVPQKSINGEEVYYILDYINNSDYDFSDLRVELSYPSGFTFKKATPEPDKKTNTWEIERLNKNERGTIKVTGILEGIQNENKTLTASIIGIKNSKLLKYTQTSSTTQISSSPLLLNLLLNGKEEEENISAGEKLNYKIEFKNNTDIALSQLILKVHLDSQVLDLRSLKLNQKGFFDSLNNVITWSAAGVSSLALLPPGESGEITFSMVVNDSFIVEDFDDKNFKIELRAELETLNVPPDFNLDKLKIEKVLTSKANSKVVLQAKGYYKENTADIKNSGPIPPKVNESTTYTIHWQIINASNDLENVKVSAILPQGIEWQNNYTSLGKGQILEFNERINQIIWEIERIPAATGYLRPAYELVFQIELKPSTTQIRSSPVLIDESSLSGKDVFTEKILESFSSAIDTSLPDDPTIGSKDKEVIE